MPKSPKLPSEKLRSLASFKKAAEFTDFLETNLYPFLDGLPATHQRSLLNIIDKTGNFNEAAFLIDYETRTKSISKELKSLRKSVDSNWRNGWEGQGEMMSEALGKILDWLPTLWKVGVEMGVEHALVHKSLMFCKSTHDSLGNTNSRTNFSDLQPPEMQIENSQGKVVYLAEIPQTEDVMLWVWRELLLSSIIHGPGLTVAKEIVADIKKLKLTEGLLELLDDETLLAPKRLPECGTKEYKELNQKLEKQRMLLQNAHWTPKMLAAAPRVKALFA